MDNENLSVFKGTVKTVEGILNGRQRREGIFNGHRRLEGMLEGQRRLQGVLNEQQRPWSFF